MVQLAVYLQLCELCRCKIFTTRPKQVSNQTPLKILKHTVASPPTYGSLRREFFFEIYCRKKKGNLISVFRGPRK